MSIHYENAPIADAVIDVQLTFDVPPTIEALKAFAAQLQPTFPQGHEIHQVEVSVGSSPAESGVRTAGLLGVRLTNSDLSRVVQARVNGISYGHLPKYTQWETFRDEFEPILLSYFAQFKPLSVQRLAVRYINQIEVPVGIDVATYLNISPRLPSGISAISNYFLQLIMSQEGRGSDWGVIVNTGIAPSNNAEKMNLILDLDVFCGEKQEVDAGKVWGVLELLRAKKNQVFEDAITEATREMIR